ncbi:MAG: hypothetical protein E7199_07530 [Schwartzia succinivorans]|nr:hypothetical protein [Schwartzia succinivorans]
MDKLVKQEKVVYAFLDAIRETKERLDVLNAYIDDNMEVSYEAVKWADVDTAKHVRDLLDEIIEFCNIPTPGRKSMKEPRNLLLLVDFIVPCFHT